MRLKGSQWSSVQSCLDKNDTRHCSLIHFSVLLRMEKSVTLCWALIHLLWSLCVLTFLLLSRILSIPLAASSSSTGTITLSWASWTCRSQKTLASMNVMLPTPLALPPWSPSSGYGATWPHSGLSWEFWQKSSSLWWSLLYMKRGRGQMKFLTVRASLQNSCNVGAGSLGVVSKHPKRTIRMLGFSPKRREGKILILVPHPLPLRLATLSYNC